MDGKVKHGNYIIMWVGSWGWEKLFVKLTRWVVFCFLQLQEQWQVGIEKYTVISTDSIRWIYSPVRLIMKVPQLIIIKMKAYSRIIGKPLKYQETAGSGSPFTSQRMVASLFSWALCTVGVSMNEMGSDSVNWKFLFTMIYLVFYTLESQNSRIYKYKNVHNLLTIYNHSKWLGS